MLPLFHRRKYARLPDYGALLAKRKPNGHPGPAGPARRAPTGPGHPFLTSKESHPRLPRWYRRDPGRSWKDNFYEDEDPEDDEDAQKDDMKMYLTKLNNRIDRVVVALKQIDNNLSKGNRGKKGEGNKKGVTVDGKSIAE